MSTDNFPITFEVGPLGINLKSCLNGYGAHVDSFYSASCGAPMTTTDQKCLSVAEKRGILLGDIILSDRIRSNQRIITPSTISSNHTRDSKIYFHGDHSQ
jgi:hypothetical protein